MVNRRPGRTLGIRRCEWSVTGRCDKNWYDDVSGRLSAHMIMLKMMQIFRNVVKRGYVDLGVHISTKLIMNLKNTLSKEFTKRVMRIEGTNIRICQKRS